MYVYIIFYLFIIIYYTLECIILGQLTGDILFISAGRFRKKKGILLYVWLSVTFSVSPTSVALQIVLHCDLCIAILRQECV